MSELKILSLPDELFIKICKFIIDKNFYSKSNIKLNTRTYLKLYLINKKNNNIKLILKNYNILYKLILKYHYYQNDYDYNLNYLLKSNLKKCKNKFNSNPILIDMLFTGCNLPRADSTFKNFNKEIFEDIKKIIKLFPSFINCNFGQLRCRTNITPLQAACYNVNIPIYVIEYLLDNGANKLDQINVNGQAVSLKNDLHYCDNNRFKELINLL